jgi:hypothetical protein
MELALLLKSRQLIAIQKQEFMTLARLILLTVMNDGQGKEMTSELTSTEMRLNGRGGG